MDKSSQEDEEVRKIMSQSRRNEQAIIVMGEASESDEEEIQQHVDQSAAKKQGDSHCNKLEKSESRLASNLKRSGEKRTLQTSKYQSLLHTKLRERNMHLRKMIFDTLLQSYELSARDVQNISQNLAKSQILVQEVGPTLRQTTSELFQLELKLDSVLENCKNLSKIK